MIKVKFLLYVIYATGTIFSDKDNCEAEEIVANDLTTNMALNKREYNKATFENSIEKKYPTLVKQLKSPINYNLSKNSNFQESILKTDAVSTFIQYPICDEYNLQASSSRKRKLEENKNESSCSTTEKSNKSIYTTCSLENFKADISEEAIAKKIVNNKQNNINPTSNEYTLQSTSQNSDFLRHCDEAQNNENLSNLDILSNIVENRNPISRFINFLEAKKNKYELYTEPNNPNSTSFNSIITIMMKYLINNEIFDKEMFDQVEQNYLKYFIDTKNTNIKDTYICQCIIKNYFNGKHKTIKHDQNLQNIELFIEIELFLKLYNRGNLTSKYIIHTESEVFKNNNHVFTIDENKLRSICLYLFNILAVNSWTQGSKGNYVYRDTIDLLLFYLYPLQEICNGIDLSPTFIKDCNELGTLILFLHKIRKNYSSTHKFYGELNTKLCNIFEEFHTKYSQDDLFKQESKEINDIQYKSVTDIINSYGKKSKFKLFFRSKYEKKINNIIDATKNKRKYTSMDCNRLFLSNLFNISFTLLDENLRKNPMFTEISKSEPSSVKNNIFFDRNLNLLLNSLNYLSKELVLSKLLECFKHLFSVILINAEIFDDKITKISQRMQMCKKKINEGEKNTIELELEYINIFELEYINIRLNFYFIVIYHLQEFLKKYQ